jgi:hypothetical protein
VSDALSDLHSPYPGPHPSGACTCDALLQLALIGGVVGAATAAGQGIQRVRRSEITAGEAMAHTGRAAMTTAAVAGLAGAAASAVGNEGVTRLAVLFLAGAAVMYGIERWSAAAQVPAP